MVLICFTTINLLNYPFYCMLSSFTITDSGLCYTFYIYFPFLLKLESSFMLPKYLLFPLPISNSSYQRT